MRYDTHTHTHVYIYIYVIRRLKVNKQWHIQGVLGGNVNIFEGHSIVILSKKSVYVRLSYSEPFLR